MQTKTMNLQKIGLVFFGFFLLVVTPSYSATYYVRTDGGSATQCTGLADAPYPGSGTAKPCAFNHPFWAIAPSGHPNKMVGGDTLIIDGSNNAEYMMGYGAPNGSGTGTCNSGWPYNCFTRSIPSGPDPAHPTRILGKGWDSGCENPPQLWGTERIDRVLNLIGSDNVELQCLEVTDHSSCQEFGPSPCNRTSYPYGPWAKNGLRATDSENVLLKNINIHGLALKGIWAGRLKDWTIEDSRIYANPNVGWDGDVGENNSYNRGTITFNRVSLQYSGCGETYPEGKPHSCYSQSQGGYGDGLGTHLTGANWVFNEVDFSHNVSDGLDLLYHDGNGTITIKRSRFEGNAGNQVKVAANALIENSVIIGNCQYFNGKSFTSTKSPGFDNCRANGNALVFALHPGVKGELYNSTLFGLGDTLIISAKRTNCDGTETITSRNNVFLGDAQFGHPDRTDLYYAAGDGGNGDGLCGQVKLNDDYSVVWGTKQISTDCQGKSHSYCQDPKLAETNIHWYNGDQFNVNLLSASPARDKAFLLTGMSSLDYNQYNRGATWDIGALEFGSLASDSGTSPVCGNGVVEGTEQCDDENTNNSDSCNTSCQIVTASPVNGVCGSTNNSCTAGTLNDTTDSSSNYLWSCTGLNGGTTAACSLAKPTDGVCGSSNNTCSVGTLSDITDSSTNYLWNCASSNGGTTASCSLPKTVLPACGNGIKEGTEACDDGNLFNGDGCSNICTTEYCGNGKVEGFEQCDDGNTASGDGCSSACIKELSPVDGSCGLTDNTCTSGTLNDVTDSITNYLWNCIGSNGGTTASCSLPKGPVCGNGVKETGEICDDGNLVSNDGCSSTCKAEWCGNGIKEGKEECDDGNWKNRDGCSATCKLENLSCGNGKLEGKEQCDDGNKTSGDGCSSTCAIEQLSVSGVCGAINNGCVLGVSSDKPDTITDYLWSCLGINGGTTATCSLPKTSVCGDGIKQTGEICDDGNLVSNDGCSGMCKKEYCGDGIKQTKEQCDDGNWINRDGCSALCKSE